MTPKPVPRPFRSALLQWALRLPFGAGRATLRACGRIAVGRRPRGVRSAGNGAAMRAAVLGVFLTDRPGDRIRFGKALAETTHLDPRAVEAALFVAELAAGAALAGDPATSSQLAADALEAVREPELRTRIEEALALARQGASTEEAAAKLGISGYAPATVALALFGFVRSAGDRLETLAETISAGGDTDSRAAILGAWLGALHGEAGLPAHLLARIHDGPFGPTHLRRLAAALTAAARGGATQPAVLLRPRRRP